MINQLKKVYKNHKIIRKTKKKFFKKILINNKIKQKKLKMKKIFKLSKIKIKN